MIFLHKMQAKKTQQFSKFIHKYFRHREREREREREKIRIALPHGLLNVRLFAHEMYYMKMRYPIHVL